MSLIQLTPDEKILKVVHRHIFSFFGDIFAVIVMFVVPIILFIIYAIVPHESLAPLFEGNPTIGILFLIVTWFIFAWLFVWWRWTDHFLDVLVITDKRLFEVKQNGFFDREVSTFGLNKIQNIKTTQAGIIASMLNYGDIFIETAGESDNLDITMVPDPSGLKKFINGLQDYTHS